MKFNESEYGYNDEHYNGKKESSDKKYIKQEQKGVTLRITSTKDSDIPGEYVEVYVVSESGIEEGHTQRFRYYTQKPFVDVDGKQKWGTFWKFRNIIISCGLYNSDESGKKSIPDSFDSNDLTGKRFIADLVLWNKYLQTQNEQEAGNDDLTAPMGSQKQEIEAPVEESVPF